MDLTFQIPMQYCSLQHRTLLLSPVTSTTGYCFCFDSIPSFFLELFLHWSPVAYWTSTNLGSSFSSILSFCLLYSSWGSQGKNTEVVCHSLLQWTDHWKHQKAYLLQLGLRQWPVGVYYLRSHANLISSQQTSYLWFSIILGKKK